MQANIFQRTLFWLLATVVALSLGYTAFRLFPVAFPIVSVDLKMDRSCALSRAQELAANYQIGPSDYHQAIAFNSDDKAKIFIQLEGGGFNKFQEVVKEEYFAPYYWQVRHFMPLEKREAMIYFMPDGRPYGFKEQLPDGLLLPNLDREQAQSLAQETAQKNWYIDFGKHTLVEHSTEEKPSGRIDHTLVYERNDVHIAQAPYRVTIRVSGNKVTKTMVDLKIPEAFERKYACMRSANMLIYTWSSTLMYILYLLLGCILGLLLLVRYNRGWLLWRAPFLWAFFISIGTLLSQLNSFPQWWMYYQTTDTTFSFIVTLLQYFILGFFQPFAILFISILAAENLTRKAFPNQVQLWPSAQPEVASSWQLAGRTIGGYLMVSWDFFFVTAFYLFSFTYLGWWSPADTLIDPNVLATYVPWFSPVIQALRAGFWEECLFRAVPLSCAALLGKRFGKINWWLTFGMITQALIFAGCHASYPAQPAYARLVELIIPSFTFGGLYLVFGLVPAIISHVVYDLILMALPIFVATTSTSFFNTVMIIMCGMLPIFVLLYARIVKGRFHTLPERWYNYLWQPTISDKKIIPDDHYNAPDQPKTYRTLLLMAGLLGFGAWAFLRRTTQDVLPLTLTREQAIEKTNDAQTYFNIAVPPTMTTLSNVEGKIDKNNMFIWRTQGKDIYKQLEGTFFVAPHWKIRHVQFDGDIAQSAEEYTLYTAHDGSILEYTHTLPKEAEGASLTQEEARALTHQVLEKYYQLKPEDVDEVTAKEEQEPHRKDWEFIYRLKQGPAIGDGQLRIRIHIGGNQVIGHDRLIHVPEDWERSYEYEVKIESLVKNGSLLLLLIFMILLGSTIMRRRAVPTFALHAAITVIICLLIKTGIQAWNMSHELTFNFVTTAPYMRQIVTLLMRVFLETTVSTLFIGALAGYVIGLLKGRCTKSLKESFTQGIALALFLAGALALCTWILPQRKPFWADVSSLGAIIPWLSMGLKAFTSMITATLISLFILHGLNVLSDYGRKQYGLLVSMLLLLGLAIAGFEPSGSISMWLLSGLGIGCLLLCIYFIALRFNYCLVPVLLATHISIDAWQNALLNAFPGVWAGAVAATLLSFAVAYYFMYTLCAKHAQ